MIKFIGENSGMKNKLTWFYNEYVVRGRNKAQKKDKDKSDVKWVTIRDRKLKRRFPGIDKLCDFRNNISHGKLDKIIADQDKVIKMRNQAKAIVAELCNIAMRNGCNIPSEITYPQVISSYRKQISASKKLVVNFPISTDSSS